MILYTCSPLYKNKLPYVPTKGSYTRHAVDMLKIKDGEKVIELGSGDGRFIAKGMRYSKGDFTGIEISRYLVLFSKFKIGMLKLLGLARGRAKIVKADFMKVSLKDYRKVFMFTLPSIVDKFLDKFRRELPDGAQILSVMFPIKADDFELLEEWGSEKYKLYLYEFKKS